MTGLDTADVRAVVDELANVIWRVRTAAAAARPQYTANRSSRPPLPPLRETSDMQGTTTA